MRIEKKGNFFLFCNQCRKGAEYSKPLQTKGNPIELIIDTKGKKYSTLEICP